MPGRPPLTDGPVLRRTAAAAALAVALGTAGCTSSSAPATGPVTVPPPETSLTPAQAQGCASLLEALPDEIDPGVERRPVEGSPRAAAWGDPAVVLQCGVAEPDRVDEPAQVNRVDWSVRDIGAGFRWTTTDLPVRVAVEIPDAYPNGAELVNPLAAPLLATIPGASPAPAP